MKPNQQTQKEPAVEWPVPVWIPNKKETDCHGKMERFKRSMLDMKGKCAYCGRDLLRNMELLLSAELDHLVPEEVFRSRRKSGGYTREGNYRNNLIFCCGACNDAKANWPLCLLEGEALRILNTLSRQDYLDAAKKFTLGHRKQKEKDYIGLMAVGWQSRAASQRVGK